MINNEKSHLELQAASDLLQQIIHRPTKASLVVYQQNLEKRVEQLEIGGIDGQNVQLNSPIFSFSLGIGNETGRNIGHTLLRGYFNFTVKHLHKDAADFPTLCSYFDPNYKLWVQRGCRQHAKNLTHVVCQCDHLTTFAVLVDFSSKYQRPATVDGNVTVSHFCESFFKSNGGFFSIFASIFVGIRHVK